MPNISTVIDEDILMVELSASRTQQKGMLPVVGYEARFNGEKEVSEISSLAIPTVGRAVLEGCIHTLEYCDGQQKRYQVIAMTSTSHIPYLAASGMEKGMPKDCLSLACCLRRMCLERPILVSVCQ